MSQERGSDGMWGRCACGCGQVVRHGKRFIRGHNSRVMSPETIEKLRQAAKKNWQNLECRKKVSEALKKFQNRPEVKEKHRGACNKPEFKERMGQIMLKRWQDPVKAAAMAAAQNRKPTSIEKTVDKLLTQLFPGEYKYVGKGEFFLGGKCPDFLNVSGQKKVIEVYGDYWHRNDNPQDRVDHFRKYGFDCLVIWEKDLQDLHSVEKQLMAFCAYAEYRCRNLICG